MLSDYLERRSVHVDFWLNPFLYEFFFLADVFEKKVVYIKNAV